jgi:hypothetical protein
MEAVLKCRLCMIGAANDPGAGHPHGGGENAALEEVLKCRLCMAGAANDPGASHPHGGGENAAALQVKKSYTTICGRFHVLLNHESK